MTDKTQYHETQVLDRIFANVAPDGAQDGCYVALWTTDPANQPDEVNHLSGDSYSGPQQVTASGWTQVQAGGPRRYENANAIDFGVLDTSTQKTVAGVVLYDGADPATANALYADALSSSKTVDAGDEFKFNAGDITVEED